MCDEAMSDVSTSQESDGQEANGQEANGQQDIGRQDIGQNPKSKHGGARPDMVLWTQKEDDLLMQLHEEKGNQWKEIAEQISSGPTSTPRNVAMVRNRYMRIQKGEARVRSGIPVNLRFNRCTKCGLPKRGHTCPQIPVAPPVAPPMPPVAQTFTPFPRFDPTSANIPVVYAVEEETASQRTANVDKALDDLCNALDAISRQDSYDEKLILLSHIPLLIQLLCHGPLTRKANAAWIMTRLPVDFYDQLTHKRAIPALVALLSHTVQSQASQGAAVALGRMAFQSEHRTEMIAAADGVEPLIHLVRSSAADSVFAHALECMKNSSARLHAEIERMEKQIALDVANTLCLMQE